MNIIPDIKIIKNEISSVIDLKNQFKSVFESDEARKIRNIVYFFLAKNPIPRFKGHSRILYIGQTTGTLHQRYIRHCGTLANKHNGTFYQNVIERYGGIQIGYVESDNPQNDEKLYFKKYCSHYLEYPPKSKI